PSAAAVAGDVGNPADVRRVFQKCRETFEHLDILVNNAGTAEIAPFTETNDELWERTLRTNLTGLFFCCREALGLMLPRKQGHIVNVLSAAAIEAYPGNSAYCASKFGAL